MTDATLSDKALSILTFAAYHSLVGGDPVRAVALDDGNGHRADPEGLAEMQGAGLLDIEGDWGRFTAAGEARLAAVMGAIRAV